MSVMTWDGTGDKKFGYGVSHGALYKKTTETSGSTTTVKWKGVPWNGLTSVSESPEGADANDFYADNILYGSLRGAEKFKGSIEAYTYPDEFRSCNGEIALIEGLTASQQVREQFRLAYRTELGDDTNSAAGYEIHLVYGATCGPSEATHETVNDNMEAATMSWDFDTVPMKCEALAKPTAHLVANSIKLGETKMTTLEGILFGTENSDPYMPDPDALVDLLS